MEELCKVLDEEKDDWWRRSYLLPSPIYHLLASRLGEMSER